MGVMEDDDSQIIASVRRILGEDAAGPRPQTASAAGADIFELEPSMMIEPSHGSGGPHEGGPSHTAKETAEADDLAPDLAAWASEWADEEAEPEPEPPPPPAATRPEPAPVAEEPARAIPMPPPAAETTSRADAPAPAPEATGREARDEGEPILEPETAEAAGQAFGSLRDAVRAQRIALAMPVPGPSVASHAGGPTIEEMIRQELRPLLKAWLDAQLPELVERVVRAEIERIVERDAT